MTAPTVLHRSLFVAVLLAAALAALAMTVAAPPAQSASSKKCTLSERQKDPAGDTPTYNLTLRVTRSTCTTAGKVMAAFHKCRAAAGVTCTKKVASHWTCSGRKTSSTPILFYASFSCKWGVRRVTSQYQQNT